MKLQDQSFPAFLSSGGDMGALIRSIDWSKTEIGPVESWPQSLRTSVSICLNSRFPIIIWWGARLRLFYNDAYYPVLGIKHPRSMGQPGSEVWSEIWNIVGPMLEGVLRTGEATWSENQLLLLERHGYAEETYHTFSYSPIRDESGGIGGVFTAVTETTETVVGERQLRTLRDLGKNISTSKTDAEVYEKAIQIIRDNPYDFPFAFIYQIEHEGTVAKLAGTTHENVPDSLFPTSIELHDETDLPWHISEALHSPHVHITDAMAQGVLLPSGAWEKRPETVLTIAVSQSGQKYPYALLIAGLNPHRYLDENYQSFFQLIADQIATNIGNVRTYEEERKRANALLEIDRAKTTFFSNISHEFRTPLTLVLGLLEDILSHIDEEKPPSFRENIEATHRNAMRLLRLVNTLLEFSRIEAGRLQARYQSLQLGSYTTDLASSFRSIIEKAGLEFQVECPPLVQPVYVDRAMWEKIVLNLLSNAFKYTLHGSILVRLIETETQAILTVTDTGVGIPEKELPHMFERFHRVQNVVGRSHEGTGIGLSLVHELVKLHHGDITVTSKEGEGSTFTVFLPLGKEHLPEQQIIESDDGHFLPTPFNAYLQEAASLIDTTRENQQITVIADEQKYSAENEEGKPIDKKFRLLVVDDNADMRSYFKQLLDKEYIVETAHNGRVGLEKMQNICPDLVISDIMMPVMDGVQLLHNIKTNPLTARIPVILLSARAGEEAKIEGYEAGADDYLVKPFSARELLARVRSQINIAKTRSAVETQLHNLFMQAPALIGILKGRNGVCELINPLFRKLWGNRDVLGKPMREAWPDLEGQGWFELVEKVFDTGTTIVRYEYRAVADWNNDGNFSEAFFNFVHTPHHDTENVVDGVMIFGFEVTDQVLARRKAEENEAYFRKMADNVPVMLWVTQPDGLCVYLNKQWYDYTGQSTATGLDLGWLEAIHPDDIQRTRNTFLEANKNKTPFTIPYRLRNKHGSYRWMIDTGTPRFAASGEFEGYVGSVVDVHESTVAEEALRESEERFRTVADTAPVMIWMSGTNKKCYFFNKGWLDFTGRSMQQEAGDGWTEQVHPDDLQHCLAIYKSSFDARQMFTMEYRLLRHDGEYRWISGQGIPRFSPSGFFEGYIGSCMDIHEKKMLSEELEKRVRERTKELRTANVALEKSNHELEQFAYIASHDLQEPLRKIQTFAELLQTNLHNQEATNKYFDKINSSAQRMSVLIRNVLDYSQLSKFDARNVNTDLNEIVENVKADFEVLIAQKNALIYYDKLPVIKGSPLQLHQLFSNLISNSLKFSHEQPVITISSSSVSADDKAKYPTLNPVCEYIRLTFQDNGIGFEQQYAEQIFTIFQRLNNRDAYAGTGIGLAICKKIVENHQGYITVQSAPGHGATFIVYLPVE